MSNFFKNLLLVIVSLSLTLLLAELALYLVLPNARKWPTNPSFYANYNSDELDRTQSLYLPEEGGKCVRVAASGGMQWHPHFGFHIRRLDQACAKTLFQSTDRESLVFMGGSAMANSGAPNSKTTIDGYLQQEAKGIVSINLAESGSRLRNEMLRMLIEVVDLGPKHVIFMDGYNEFSSTRYGGGTEYDFYWTAGVYERIHAPVRFFGNQLIMKSRLLTLLLLNTGLVRIPGGVQKEPSKEAVMNSADQYVSDVRKSQKICQSHNLKCHFFLQPHIYQKKNLSSDEKKLVQFFDKRLPGGQRVLNEGYARIKEFSLELNLHDLSSCANQGQEGFLDEVHIGKDVNACIANEIKRVLNLTSSVKGTDLKGTQAKGSQSEAAQKEGAQPKK